MESLIFCLGPSINDVSTKGEGGRVKNVGIYFVKRWQREGDHKIGKMGRRRLWMNPFDKRFFVSFKDLKISNFFTKVSHRDVRSPRSDRLGFAFLQRDMISKDRISPRSQQRRMNSQTTYNISHMQICFIRNCKPFIFWQ